MTEVSPVNVDVGAWLDAALGVPRVVEVDGAMWSAAATLGGLRQASNDPIRAKHRDRGESKNTAADLQGCFGELVVGTLVEAAVPGVSLECQLLDWDGPVDDVDLKIGGRTRQVLVETKCHLDELNKRLFLVNKVAAERSAVRGAEFFIPVFSRVGAGRALVGRHLPVAAVQGWRIENFQYGDRARAEQLDTVLKAHFDCDLGTARKVIGDAPSVTDAQGLNRVAQAAREGFEEFRARQVAIPESPAEAVLALSHSIWSNRKS
jgi:hypothetical protein